jgi:hypothetical protein
MPSLTFKTTWRNEDHHWSPDGEKITDERKLEVIRQVLDKAGPIPVEHWFYVAAAHLTGWSLMIMTPSLSICSSTPTPEMRYTFGTCTVFSAMTTSSSTASVPLQMGLFRRLAHTDMGLPNQSVERMTAGGRLMQYQARWAAAIAHLCVR